MAGHDLIAVGASAGGVEALRRLAATLPADLPAAVLVTLHLSPIWPSVLPKVLESAGPLRAVHPRNGERIEPGTIYAAPPDRHLLVERGHLHLSRGPRENRFRPAVDPLFRSAALHYGPRAVGVVLTGGLYDGAAGLYDIKRRGGVAVVEDPTTAAFPSMPWSALRAVSVDHVVRLEEMGPLLGRLAREDAPDDREYPVQKVMELESRIVAMDPVSVEEMNSVGKPSGYVCPECHGALWRLNGDGPVRLRCHVGHAFSPESLTLAQREQEEDNLWRALQSMDERAAFMRQMAAEARTDHRPDIARSWEGDLERLDVHAKALRGLLSEKR